VSAVDPFRFQLGEEQAVRDAIAHCSPHLQPLIASFAPDADDDQDLLQETWIRAYQKRHTYAGGSFMAWLCAVCRNVCIDRYRREYSRKRLLLFESDLEPPRVRSSEERVDLARIIESITELPARQRDAITYRLIEGYSTMETARRMGCAEGTVKALVHQAIATLRATLNPKENAS
jgi:RNA polymerase sigma-70 factor (ECF subfamily)